jgi:hypothetical protein
MPPARTLVAEALYVVLFDVYFKSNMGASSFKERLTEEDWHEFASGHTSGGCGNFHTNSAAGWLRIVIAASRDTERLPV